MYINYAYNVETCEYIMKNTFNSPDAVRMYLEENEAEDTWVVTACNIADQAAKQYHAAVSIHNNNLSLNATMEVAGRNNAVTTMKSVADDTNEVVPVITPTLSTAMHDSYKAEIATKEGLRSELEAKLLAYDELAKNTNDSTDLVTIETNKTRVMAAVKGLTDRINYVKAQLITTKEEATAENVRVAAEKIDSIDEFLDAIEDLEANSPEVVTTAPLKTQFEAGAVNNTNQPAPADAAEVKVGQNEQSLRDDIAVLKCAREGESLTDKIERQKALKVKEEALAVLLAE